MQRTFHRQLTPGHRCHFFWFVSRRVQHVKSSLASRRPHSQGTYPSPVRSRGVKNYLGAKSHYFSDRWVAGSEGWGRVASDSKNLRKGSLVAIGTPGLGTLRSSVWVPETSLLLVAEELLELTGPAGCSLAQLGGTALRMLSDFECLEPGDVVSTLSRASPLSHCLGVNLKHNRFCRTLATQQWV